MDEEMSIWDTEKRLLALEKKCLNLNERITHQNHININLLDLIRNQEERIDLLKIYLCRV